MLGTLAFIAVANMPNLLSYPQGRFYCVQSNEAQTAANIISILLRAYIPFALMLVFDIIVFKRLRNSRRRVGVTQMGQRKQPGQFSNKEYNFMISTVFIDLTFVVFYIPISAYVTVTVVNTYVTWNYLTDMIFNIFYSCAVLLSFLYSVVLFFIFLIFNRFFRSEVFRILRLNRLFHNLEQTANNNTNNQTI